MTAEPKKDCPACDGSGVEVFAVTVYEPGCGYSHDSTDERPCPTCNGVGEVGSFDFAEGAYRNYPCPNCRNPGECDGSCTHPVTTNDDPF